MVLIIVLVVVVVLALAAYTFSEMMLAHYEAALLNGRQIQARSLVDSGVESVSLFLAETRSTRLAAGGTYDNQLQFRGALVAGDEDPSLRGRFSIVAPAMDDEGNWGGLRFGLEDESSRLNLNALLLGNAQSAGGGQQSGTGQSTGASGQQATAALSAAAGLTEDSGRQLLMALPGMTEEIADAILDWIDEDDEPREYGAEADYYANLQPPYAPKNGPLDTVEELLLVRGVLPQLLFGADANRNGMIDPSEQQDALLLQASFPDGSLDRGWAAYMTLHSKEGNIDAAGQPRIYLNTEDMQQLYDQLSSEFNADWATFIVAYRQNGPSSSSNSRTQSSASGKQLDLTKPGTQQGMLTQVLDMVGKSVSVTFMGEREATVLASPFSEAGMAFYLPQLMDRLTINPASEIPGRININQAPRAILMGIPGMDETIVNEIISRRTAQPSEEDANRQHETWILTEAIVTLDEMRALMPFVCAGGDVYRAQVIGYFQDGGAAARTEVIWDASSGTPRVLFWRDLSHLGRGYALETLGVELEEGF
jgi:hypothetical protein